MCESRTTELIEQLNVEILYYFCNLMAWENGLSGCIKKNVLEPGHHVGRAPVSVKHHVHISWHMDGTCLGALSLTLAFAEW